MKNFFLLMLCVLAFASVKAADDEQLSRSIVGTWVSSYDQPIYDGTTVHIQETYTFRGDGRFAYFLAQAGPHGSGTNQAQGIWEISDGSLTLTFTGWTVMQPGYDDGPTSPLQNVTQNSFHCHGVNWTRY